MLSTRLFWALGFAADEMYPVRIRCRGCPEDPGDGPARAGVVAEFDPAAVERKLPGRAMETTTDSGWAWSELEDIGPDAAPGARAERNALKLLAAFVQHTDSKAANQRLLCPKGEEVGRTGCRSPVLMVSDLGLTFGHAGMLNKNSDSASLANWTQVPVWKDRARCEARLKGSFTGSLSNPTIRRPFQRPGQGRSTRQRRRVGCGLQAEAGPDRRSALPVLGRVAGHGLAVSQHGETLRRRDLSNGW